MRKLTLTATIICSSIFVVIASGQEIISDHFDDGILGENATGVGNGFSTANGSGWVEADSKTTHATTITAGSDFSTLTSLDSFVANSATDSEFVRVSFTLSDWLRSIDTTLATNWNGRFALGVRNSSGATTNPFEGNVDGFWIGMNFDSDTASGVGVAGITYIDGGTPISLGDTWEWDDNDIDTPGATLADVANSSIGDFREDRVDIAMNAEDLTITIGLGVDSWSIDFSSTDPNVVVPPSQSGTFSEAGATNNLSDAVVAVYHQGDHGHTASFDSIIVEQGLPRLPIKITDFSINENMLSLKWTSTLGTRYAIRYSLDLKNWSGDFNDGFIAGDGETSSVTYDLESYGLQDVEDLFIRVE